MAWWCDYGIGDFHNERVHEWGTQLSSTKHAKSVTLNVHLMSVNLLNNSQLRIRQARLHVWIQFWLRFQPINVNYWSLVVAWRDCRCWLLIVALLFLPCSSSSPMVSMAIAQLMQMEPTIDQLHHRQFEHCSVFHLFKLTFCHMYTYTIFNQHTFLNQFNNISKSLTKLCYRNQNNCQHVHVCLPLCVL
jgi:hypothetical protein